MVSGCSIERGQPSEWPLVVHMGQTLTHTSAAVGPGTQTWPSAQTAPQSQAAAQVILFPGAHGMVMDIVKVSLP